MDSAAHIVIVEDDAKISALLGDYMEAAGYRATRIMNGAHAVEALRADGADVVLLDLNLPGLDGLEVCRAVRTFSQAPIIMLTARVDEVDRLLGLDAGADDYVCKPFSPREVVARVRAQLRRASGALAPQPATSLFTVERERMRILLSGAPLSLTPVEFRILAELIEHPDRVYSRQQLLDVAHEDQRDISDRTVDSHIKNIRRKLAGKPAAADCLQSVYGVGYRFELALC
jgi:two-component system, OmpR family, response regulator BaeR